MRMNATTAALLPLIALLALLPACSSSDPAPPDQIAVAHRDDLVLVDPAGVATPITISRYHEIFALDYDPTGAMLALAECRQYRVVELEAGAYAEVAVPFQGNGCPRSVAWAPVGGALAAGLPFRPDPSAGQWFGHVMATGPVPLDLQVIGPAIGPPSPAVAWRPGGGALAVGASDGVRILSPGPGWPVLHLVPGLLALSFGYTIEGSRLVVGTSQGFEVLDAAAGYASVASVASGAVRDVAVDPRGQWIALVGNDRISVRRAPDLQEVALLTTTGSFRDADFAPDGSELIVAESPTGVRRFAVPTGSELSPIPFPDQVRAVAWRPRAEPTTPVLFVHGHSGGSGEAWFEAGAGTSFAEALAVNADLGITAFYLELPVHGGGQPQVEARSIADDATDVLAAIEGGPDSQGAEHVGILNLPAFAASGRVAIIAYSQGTISARYYAKNLMGSRIGGNAVTIAELVALASPTHGIGGTFTCGDSSEPDRARRELCGGLTASAASQLAPCGLCGPFTPAPFSTNLGGETTFLTALNGHPFADSCAASPTHAGEAPRSRPGEPGGILHAHLHAAGNADAIVGGQTQSGDCIGRRLARNLAPDAVNREVQGVPGSLAQVHANFPHHWPTIALALRTVVDHAVPADAAAAAASLVQP